MSTPLASPPSECTQRLKKQNNFDQHKNNHDISRDCTDYASSMAIARHTLKVTATCSLALVQFSFEGRRRVLDLPKFCWECNANLPFAPVPTSPARPAL